MNIKSIIRIVAVAAVATVAFLIINQFQKPEANTENKISAKAGSAETASKPELLKKEAVEVKSAVDEASKTNIAEKVEDSEKNIAKEVPPTADELKIMEQIDEYVGDDEFRKIVQAARKIMNSPSPEVRSEAADAFGWAGVQGIKDLQKMLLDSDPDVAADAYDNWDSAVDEVEDEETQADLLADGIKNMTNQEDIEDALMSFDSMEDRYAIPQLVDIIENGTPVASELAREHYDFTTGEPYVSPEVANAYIAAQSDE